MKGERSVLSIMWLFLPSEAGNSRKKNNGGTLEERSPQLTSQVLPADHLTCVPGEAFEPEPKQSVGTAEQPLGEDTP